MNFKEEIVYEELLKASKCNTCNVNFKIIQLHLSKMPIIVQEDIKKRKLKYKSIQCPKCKKIDVIVMED